MSERRVRLGLCSVDSGTLMVVDPCYVDAGSRRRGLREEEWRNPLNVEYGRLYRTNDEEGLARAAVRAGIVFSTQIGDGEYPVEAVLDDAGMLLRVEILITQCAPGDVDDEAEPPVLGEGIPMDDLIKLADEVQQYSVPLSGTPDKDGQ